MSLTLDQEFQVRRIVDEKFTQHSFSDSLSKFLDKARLNDQIREKTNAIVPRVCQDWVSQNMRIETESVTNNFMRNNFGRFFKQEIADNRDVNGFITAHLQSVKDCVESASDSTVKKIVDTSTQFNPIFQKHLEVLGQRNKVQLDEQLIEIRASKSQLDNALRDNVQLNKEISSLKSHVNTLTGFTTLSLAGVVGLGVSVFLQTKSKL